MTWRAMLPAIAVAVAVGATRVDAKLCGDDVGGQDVACACGDVIVSDVVLDASDPVTQERCAADGLVVRSPQASHGLTVDLRGQSLRGSGHGAGILLLDGGPGGASVVSTGGTTATIEGFQDGVLAHGDTAVAAV